MTPFVGELTGTALMMVLGNGVVANVVLHALLPIPAGKYDSDWAYAWVPVIGPLPGAALAASLYVLLRGPTTPLSR